jgi:pimeloyl-ACP methyl ester carboxylesterase
MHTMNYDGHTLTWEEHSTGDHTFIFVPGHANVRPMWYPMLEELASLGRWVSLDLLGHYPAQLAPDLHMLTQEYVFDVYTAAVQHISGNRSVTLAGHSTGGLVALGVAARLPQQVRRVISLSSVVWGPLDGFLGYLHWILRHRLDTFFTGIGRLLQSNMWTFMAGAALYTHRRSAFLQNQIAWQTYGAAHNWFCQHSLTNLALVLRMLETCDIRPLVASLPMPVLAVTGVCDPVVPPQQTLWLAEHLPQADLRVIDHTGHILNLEAPDELVCIIKDWVAQHPV